ncbi:MAG TPA: HAMP domain-containing sensor histidine kinase [Polyangiaceae bacterium]|nr:HAMP domain-containing sensor histidine kinase [Polyangiaceae bacterium]
MRERRFGLRGVLTVLAVAVTSLALTVLILLLIMTQYSSRVSAALANSVENVRAVEETQIALLMHERERDAVKASELEAEMQRNLASIEAGATFETRDAVARAAALVRDYLGAVHARLSAAELEPRSKQAFDVLDEVSDLNIAEARSARDTAARWDVRLNLLGSLAMALVLLLTGSLLWWMRMHAFQPVLELARVMDRFGRGEHDVRAEERGPTELREMVERFNQMASALAAQRQAQVAFLAGVAHDLRNPLSALSMSVSLIEPNAPLPPEPRIRRTIELVRRQLKKLERMVSDFMDMTKVEAGRLELQFEPHDLTVLARDVVSLFEATEPEQRIELSVPGDPIRVECDSLRIEQVMSNLISNALKYSPSARKIEVSLAREDGEACFSVRDYGIGISEEDQRRLFEPFQRAGLSKDTIPGAGLGLYVVQRLVQAHSGRIEVSSAPGEGALFTVRLPLPPAVADPLARSAELGLSA